MRSTTDEFSFMVKPSTIPEAGVGLFAMHDIAAGTELAVEPKDETYVTRRPEEVPKAFWGLCEFTQDGMLYGPRYFNRLSVEAFINHSDDPNTKYREEEGTTGHFALRDIKAGEEILMDYRDLNEPSALKEAYFK